MTIKQERVQELIMAHLGSILLLEVTDPALKDLTITDVRVDREIEYADIYVHAFGDDSREKEVLAGLRRANAFLRRNLAGRLSLRKIPVLHFHWDHLLASGEHMEQLLDSLQPPPPAKKKKTSKKDPTEAASE